jgi:starch synthase
VSPTHAVEALTPEYSYGLLDTLQEIRGKLTGILNGLDTQEFDPSSDPLVRTKYGAKSFVKARAANKTHLQKEFSLPQKPDAPLLAYVGRLTMQKGMDLLIEALPRLFEEREDVQFVAVGGGEEKYRNELDRLKEAFPKNIGLYLVPDFRLPRKVFSGADLTLIPSIFEPGGIVALEALRYGAVPLVRKTGGLSDIVRPFDPAEREGTGFLFERKTSWALFASIIEALTVYKQPKLWERLVSNALSQDFSWDHAAKEYVDWYRGVASDRRRALDRGSSVRRALF